MPVVPIPGPGGATAGGTCSPWATSADVCSPCDDYSFDPALLDDTLQAASDVLFDLTGRRWPGECTDTLRPCGFRGEDGAGGGTFPIGQLGTTLGACGCRAPLTCGCGGLSEVRLPGYPVVSIDQVKIDGAVQPADRYRLDENRWLVWIGDDSDSTVRRRLPCCQRLRLADTEENTWSVTYTYGQGPPIGGVLAAASLGCQLAMACQPETVGACRLPRRVTSITRQGVTTAVLDPLSLFQDGKTGLAEVDLWVASVNRGAKQRRATVMLPAWVRQRSRRAGT